MRARRFSVEGVANETSQRGGGYDCEEGRRSRGDGTWVRVGNGKRKQALAFGNPSAQFDVIPSSSLFKTSYNDTANSESAFWYLHQLIPNLLNTARSIEASKFAPK